MCVRGVVASHLSENDMEAVEVAKGHGGDEELAPVGVRSGIGHGQELRVVASVRQCRCVYVAVSKGCADRA